MSNTQRHLLELYFNGRRGGCRKGHHSFAQLAVARCTEVVVQVYSPALPATYAIPLAVCHLVRFFQCFSFLPVMIQYLKL